MRVVGPNFITDTPLILQWIFGHPRYRCWVGKPVRWVYMDGLPKFQFKVAEGKNELSLALEDISKHMELPK